MVTKSDVSVRRTSQGAWECSAVVVDGIHAYLEHCQYFDFTKSEAVKNFLERCNSR
jgi:hypothetical protein